jgi:hypothetical protein
VFPDILFLPFVSSVRGVSEESSLSPEVFWDATEQRAGYLNTETQALNFLLLLTLARLPQYPEMPVFDFK